MDEDLIDQEVDSKDHPLGGAPGGSGLKTQLSGDGGWLFLFLLVVQLPDIPRIVLQMMKVNIK